MRQFSVRLTMLLATVLAALAVSACGGGDLAATPTPLPSPTATEEPTATPTATRTPTRTRTPTPTVSPAVALLQQVKGKQEDLKSYRAQMEMNMDVAERGVPQSVTMLVDMEVAEPDMRMKMETQGMPLAFDIELIAKGDVVYMKMGDEWTAMPGSADGNTKSQLSPVDDEQLQAFLAFASNATMAGRRDVKGVECDVVTFSVPWDKAVELAEMTGSASGQGLSNEDFNYEEFQGEVAIGVEDKLVHQMSFSMSGSNKDKPAERFSMDFLMTLWDINAEDIVIQAPEGVKVRPTPTPLA